MLALRTCCTILTQICEAIFAEDDSDEEGAMRAVDAHQQRMMDLQEAYGKLLPLMIGVLDKVRCCCHSNAWFPCLPLMSTRQLCTVTEFNCG